MVGTVVSSGIALGKIYKLQRAVLSIEKKVSDPDTELLRYENVVKQTVSYYEELKAESVGKVSDDCLMVFDAHLMMASDPELRSQVEQIIKTEGVNAEYAIQKSADEIIALFESIEDPLFQERAVDLREVVYRMNCALMNIEVPDLSSVKEPVIVAASDLLPCDITSVKEGCALGFVCEHGGASGHGAILARNMGIPAITGIKGLLNSVTTGTEVVLDAVDGKLIISPGEQVQKEYREKIALSCKNEEKLKELIHEPSITKDGHQIRVSGNVGSLNDCQRLIDNGAEGIGLFRTEFLFMESKNGFPTEEDQFQCYKQTLEKMGENEVIIRTCDIGSDKQLSYYRFDDEANPSLGMRAIRFSLQKRDVFRTQLRALYRASVYGKMAIMFPMIATIDEYLAAKEIALQVKGELEAEGINVSEDVAIGCMIETPAAVLIADKLGRYADFFSIGTNDLIQYTMAADRQSTNVSYLYQPMNPSVLKMIAMTINSAHQNGIPCNMCGEMASDTNLVNLLIGMGIDELSVNASSVLKVRDAVRSASYMKDTELVEAVLDKETSDEVLTLLNHCYEI